MLEICALLGMKVLGSRKPTKQVGELKCFGLVGREVLEDYYSGSRGDGLDDAIYHLFTL